MCFHSLCYFSKKLRAGSVSEHNTADTDHSQAEHSSEHNTDHCSHHHGYDLDEVLLKVVHAPVPALELLITHSPWEMELESEYKSSKALSTLSSLDGFFGGKTFLKKEAVLCKFLFSQGLITHIFPREPSGYSEWHWSLMWGFVVKLRNL